MDSVHQGYDDSRFTNPVDEDLHCAICLNVLREPVQCQINEHHFCRPCITRYLKNFQTCPSCMETLSVKTLRKPSRYLTMNLSKLEIRCDYENRGCHELLRLENLARHVDNCECAPVSCSNSGCCEVISKRDQVRHERLECMFRKERCPDCRELKNEVEQMKIRLNELSGEMQSKMREMQDEIRKLKQQVDPTTSTTDVQCKEVVITGGRKMNGYSRQQSWLKSTEIFSWKSKSWRESVFLLKENREAASASVFENFLLVTGGYDAHKETNTIEAVNMKAGGDVPWFYYPVELPLKCQGHKSLVYEETLFVIGGFNVGMSRPSDAICEICLNQPYRTTIRSMPQPRCYHAAVCFGDNIVIAGGQTSGSDRDCIDSVVLYDVVKKTFRTLKPLPFRVTDMASVGWRDSLILIGGINKHFDQLNTVLQYDVKNEECKMLPPMMYKRQGCSAVVTGNVIVVMGGYNKEQGCLDTAECFHFETNAWEELPPMNEPRVYASAVAKF